MEYLLQGGSTVTINSHPNWGTNYDFNLPHRTWTPSEMHLQLQESLLKTWKHIKYVVLTNLNRIVKYPWFTQHISQKFRVKELNPRTRKKEAKFASKKQTTIALNKPIRARNFNPKKHIPRIKQVYGYTSRLNSDHTYGKERAKRNKLRPHVEQIALH